MKEIIDFLTNNSLGAGIIGGFIVWIITQVKSVNEIAKLKKEVSNLEIGQYKELYLLEDKYNSAKKQLEETLKEILLSIKNNDDAKLSTEWNKLNSLFFIDFIGIFYQYVRMSKRLYKNERNSKIDFIDDELFPFLKFSTKILSMVNNENISNRNNSRKITASRSTFAFAIKYIERNIRFYDIKRKNLLEEYCQKLQLEP